MMNTTIPDAETLRSEVRRRYGAIAEGSADLLSSKPTNCCSTDIDPTSCGCSPTAQGETLGYSVEEMAQVPEGANLGLGCGNPLAIASLKPGQTVVDLGAGAGFDAFLAARAVGSSGSVIGVDMTPEMVAKARGIAKKSGYAHVDFRLGEIEALPVADATADVIISNCVINLCPDKRRVYREAFRVLKPGGRIAVSDVVAREVLSDAVKQDLALHSGCLAGATPYDELIAILQETGFTGIEVRPKSNTDEVISSWDAVDLKTKVFAAEVLATKPSEACCSSDCCT